jgi:hypothetical protein
MLQMLNTAINNIYNLIYIEYYLLIHSIVCFIR